MEQRARMLRQRRPSWPASGRRTRHTTSAGSGSARMPARSAPSAPAPRLTPMSAPARESRRWIWLAVQRSVARSVVHRQLCQRDRAPSVCPRSSRQSRIARRSIQRPDCESIHISSILPRGRTDSVAEGYGRMLVGGGVRRGVVAQTAVSANDSWPGANLARSFRVRPVATRPKPV